MKLLVKVDLGNAAMQSADDAMRAIEKSMGRNGSEIHAPLGLTEGATIRDDNGNTVGEWQVVE